jgi:hypothetical protein
MRKNELESLRSKAAPAKAKWDYRDTDIERIVERAATRAEKDDKLLWECMPDGITHFERELIKAVFAEGRRSVFAEGDDDRKWLLEEFGIGLVA